MIFVVHYDGVYNALNSTSKHRYQMIHLFNSTTCNRSDSDYATLVCAASVWYDYSVTCSTHFNTKQIIILINGRLYRGLLYLKIETWVNCTVNRPYRLFIFCPMASF